MMQNILAYRREAALDWWRGPANSFYRRLIEIADLTIESKDGTQS
jgi:hypothetical protein